MPDMTPFGWFHTVLGITALLTGLLSFLQYKLITSTQVVGKLYLLCTFMTAASALGIYNQGGFGIAHILAVLTLGALIVGMTAEKTPFFGNLSGYIQAITYSATFLFHMIPAITDGLMRLPVGDPIVTDIADPLLRGFYLSFLVAYLVGVTAQIVMLRRRGTA